MDFVADHFRIHNSQPEQTELAFAKAEDRQFRSIREIVAAVAQEEGISVSDMLTPYTGRSDPAVSWAKTRAYIIADNHILPSGRKRWTRSQVARVFGFTSPSAVTAAIRKYKDTLPQ